MYVSPYRNIYCEQVRPENFYSEVNIPSPSVDTNFMAANYKFIAVPWASAGGGVFTVLSTNGNGKIGSTTPLFSGHTNPVLDLAFNPFNDNILASASDDATIRIWNVETDGTTIKGTNEALSVIKAHSRKAQRIVFNPTVANCLASFGADNAIKIWDISRGENIHAEKPAKDAVLDINWNQNGTLLVYPMKDKKLHCMDPRNGSEVFCVNNHPGLRGSRAVFYDKQNIIFSTGFSASSQRQIGVRDMRNPENFLQSIDVDSNSSVIAPFIDADLGVVYTFARGDSQFRYYELNSVENPLVPLSGAAVSDSLRAFAYVPKYCCDVAKCEVARFYVATQSKQIQTLKCIIPRKNADVFQSDVYPLTPAPEPALGIPEWKEGITPEPKLISLENGFTPAESTGFSVSQVEQETIESVKAELQRAKARIAELEAEIQTLKSQ